MSDVSKWVISCVVNDASCWRWVPSCVSAPGCASLASRCHDQASTFHRICGTVTTDTTRHTWWLAQRSDASSCMRRVLLLGLRQSMWRRRKRRRETHMYTQFGGMQLRAGRPGVGELLSARCRLLATYGPHLCMGLGVRGALTQGRLVLATLLTGASEGARERNNACTLHFGCSLLRDLLPLKHAHRVKSEACRCQDERKHSTHFLRKVDEHA